MTINTFRNECLKIQKKYGKRKIPNKFLNEVWGKIKHLPDEFLEQRVSWLMTNKPIHGESFTIEDFLPKKEATSTHYEQVKFKDVIGDEGQNKSQEESKKRKKKTGLNLPPWQYKAKVRDNGQGLKEYLSELGAGSAVEAMKILASRLPKD